MGTTKIRYGSVCSGIEAATAAWHLLGWEPQWFSEIEPFPCRLLKHYYPEVPNLGDMLKIEANEIFQHSVIDLLVGGTPCQSFSTAGLRGGLGDSRGNLALEFCRILVSKQPRWFLWENVPGVLSSKSGSKLDFATLLEAFRDCGYCCAWRVLDAQFFGVPQRRRRVFVVGYLGNDWRPPAAVLFESEGLRGDPEKGGIERKEVAGTIGKRTGGRSIGADEAGGGMLIAGTPDASSGRSRGAGINPGAITISSLTARPYADNESSESKLIIANTLRGAGHAASDDGTRASLIVGTGSHCPMATGQPNAEILADLAPTLNCNHEQPIVFPINTQVGLREHKDGDGTGLGIGAEGDPSYTIQKAHHHAVFMAGQGAAAKSIAYSEQNSPTLRAGQSGTNRVPTAFMGASAVRRLTPLECERLQGFPDGYTAIPEAADSPRYQAIGNSMAVPVMRWIGKRIDHFERTKNSMK